MICYWKREGLLRKIEKEVYYHVFCLKLEIWDPASLLDNLEIFYSFEYGLEFQMLYS